MKVNIFKADKAALLPVYAKPGDVGADLVAVSREVKIINEEPVVIYDTGLIVVPPVGYHVEIAARSSVSTKTNLNLANSVGIIDQEYRGTLKFFFKLTGYTKPTYDEIVSVQFDSNREDTITVEMEEISETTFIHRDYRVYKVGERIGQMILRKTEKAVEFAEIDSFSETERGSGGFGSTGTGLEDKWQIWREGMTNLSGVFISPAIIGESYGKTFEDAVKNYIEDTGNENIELVDGRYSQFGCFLSPTEPK